MQVPLRAATAGATSGACRGFESGEGRRGIIAQCGQHALMQARLMQQAAGRGKGALRSTARRSVTDRIAPGSIQPSRVKTEEIVRASRGSPAGDGLRPIHPIAR